jgi:hypothetical protein
MRYSRIREVFPYDLFWHTTHATFCTHNTDRCNIFLTKTAIQETCSCIEGGIPVSKTLEVYKTNGKDPHAFAILKRIHQILWNGITPGGKRSRRVRKMKGGMNNIRNADAKFSQAFIDFIHTHMILPIAAIRPTLTGCKIIYEGGDNIVIRYEYGNYELALSHLFVIEGTHMNDAWQAFQIPVPVRTPVHVQTLQAFELHMQRLIPAMA